MRPIREGDRGAAVEDIQRRLRILGHDIGPTGVDGVFQGATLSAVSSFQRARNLDEDGVVGAATWAALVDATFALGDRLLYLKAPHLHGADVRVLQGALNVLGFAAGAADGIFGAYTERAVREFQGNAGLPADGIVGPETVRALGNLRHVWADKAPEAPGALRRAPARAADVLARWRVAVVPDGEAADALAARLVNLALASNPDSRVHTTAGGTADVIVRLAPEAPACADDVPVVMAGEGGDPLARRVELGIRSAAAHPVICVVLDRHLADEHQLQRMAVGLLDGLCVGLAAVEPPVVP